jgi:type IV secretory pathway VirB2 component (pilin)
MRSTPRKMNSLYLVLDVLLGNVPKRYLIAEVVAGSVVTITGALDWGLRVLVAIVTLLVGYYAIKSHKAATHANKTRAALDELTIRIKQEELEAIRLKNASSENP